MDQLGQKLCTVITVLVLVVSLFAHGAPTMAMGDTMAGTGAVAHSSSGAVSQDDCTAHDMSEAVCQAVCAAATAVLTDMTRIHAGPGPELRSGTSQAYIGHDSNPDPAPPRPAMVI
jgi:hypothetical protein